MFARKDEPKIFTGLFIIMGIILIIYFFSIPKILMVGFPNEMVYQYNGPFVFENTDTIGNKKLNEFINFNNYDMLILAIPIYDINKYGYKKKLKNFTGKIIFISSSKSLFKEDRSKIISISPRSKVYIYDHYLNSDELEKILLD